MWSSLIIWWLNRLNKAIILPRRRRRKEEEWWLQEDISSCRSYFSQRQVGIIHLDRGENWGQRCYLPQGHTVKQVDMSPVLWDPKAHCFYGPTHLPQQRQQDTVTVLGVLLAPGRLFLFEKSHPLTYIELKTYLICHMSPKETWQMTEKPARPVKIPSVWSVVIIMAENN